MRYKSVVLAFTLAAAATAHPAADAGKLRTYVQTLASERFGGRLTGTEGEALARQFIIAELKRIGAKPLPGRNDFEIPFEFTAGTRDGGSRLGVIGDPRSSNEGFVVAGPGPNVRALSFSDNGDITAPVVFAGYGIVVPESQNFGYDSYATLDVKDKIVLVLAVLPRGGRPGHESDSRAIRRPPLQGHGRPATRREGDDRRHRTALAERRRTGADDV